MKMRAELLALFPAGVAGAELTRLEEAEPPLPGEAAGLERAVPRRLREFAAGRHCAREALAELGLPRVALPRRADRQPEWPPGVVGSISHSSDYCAAVVARSATCAGIGFDAEEWGRVTPEIWSRIATPSELARLSATGDSGERWATVLFSAKEAFYKAQFVQSQSFLGFHAVAFRPLGPGGFEIELLREVPGVGRAGDRFAGRHAACSARCYAGLCLPPRPVADPGSIEISGRPRRPASPSPASTSSPARTAGPRPSTRRSSRCTRGAA
jgi:4'-phosphopantetheinyl transferase EntD